MRHYLSFAFVLLIPSFSFAQDFRVQIAAFEEPAKASYFSERGVEAYLETQDQMKVYRYFAGAYATRQEAETVKQDLVAKGFPFATVIDLEEQRILCEINCPYFRNGVLFIPDPDANVRNVYFDFGLSTLTTATRSELDKVALRLIKNKSFRLNILGYTDGIGSPQANVELAGARARAARNYLINKGIRADRMFIKVFGEADPVAPNGEDQADGTVIDLPENRKWNRRVVLVVLE